MLLQFPRLSRYTLGATIDELILEMLESILRAGYAPRETKRILVDTASTKLDVLKFFLKIAWEIHALNQKNYAALSEPLVTIGKMLGGWRKTLSG